MQDRLLQLLSERMTPIPSVSSKLPPAWQRHLTALRMQDAYKNAWSPNPTLIRILEGNK